MKTKMMMLVMISLAILGFISNANAEMLSIYQIQCTPDPNGDSIENGNVVDCLGGVVTYKVSGGTKRLVIQDPNCSGGWSAIQSKDLTYSGAFDNINVGDYVRLYNVLVEEFRGTTFIQYDIDSSIEVISTGNPLPLPIMVSPKDISAPTEVPDLYGDIESALVDNHNAEKYESVLIQVVNVFVEDTGHGKAYDNYLLTSNANPALTCWAADYMNSDKGDLDYHAEVMIDSSFCSVTGILEQYTASKNGIDYDYYQLLTLNTDSFSYINIGDLDGDGDVDFDDNEIFGKYWRLFEGK